MQVRFLAAAGAIAVVLTGCTALSPTTRTAAQVPPAAGEPRPAAAPVQPGTAPGVVRGGEPGRSAVAAQSARAQIAPIPPVPSVPPAQSAAGLTVVGSGTV